MAVTLHFLLMGKTGEGKSATGNFLIDHSKFITSANSTSQTKDVRLEFAHFGRYTLLVVDGPGLEDTDLSKVDDRTEAVKNMGIALARCYGTVDAFIFVTKFGGRFTAEDRSALEALKRIFGDSYMKHVIVVVTHGDLFQSAVDDGEITDSFHEWCKIQKGSFRELYAECEGRFVLLNNREKNEEKKQSGRQEIVKLAQKLRDKHGPYTSKAFQDAEREREKLIIEEKAPQLTREIQEKISLLTSDIQKLPEKLSECDRKNIEKRIQDLENEIMIQDKGFGVLGGLMGQVELLKQNIGNRAKLQEVAKEMEKERNEGNVWDKLGSAILGFIKAIIEAAVSICK